MCATIYSVMCVLYAVAALQRTEILVSPRLWSTHHATLAVLLNVLMVACWDPCGVSNPDCSCVHACAVTGRYL